MPGSGEVGWSSLSNFLIALGTNAAIAQEMKQAIRVATTTPVTVSDTTDCVVATNLAVAGAVAVTLPAGTDGRWFAIVDQKGDANTNNITITPNGAETINGSATYVINQANEGVILAYSTTGTRWNVIGRFTAGSPLTNPMDSAGDMIYGGTGGAATKLDNGSSGQLLMANGAAAPTWVNTVTGAKTFTGIVEVSAAGGGNYAVVLGTTTTGTPYGVQVRDSSGSTAGFPIFNITNNAGSTEFFRVGSNTGVMTASATTVGTFSFTFSPKYTDPFGVRIQSPSGAANGYPLFSVNSFDGSTQYFRVDSGGGIYIDITTSTSIGAAGGASALPATPLGYLPVFINGVSRKIPYYNS